MQGQQQNMSGGMQRLPIMQNPPQVVTTKDLSYLKDAMSWELLAMKKCAHYAGECQDTEVKQCIDKIGQMHQRHFNQLLQKCQPTNNQQAGSMQPAAMQQGMQSQNMQSGNMQRGMH